MPTYDYKCTACEHTFTKMLKIAEMNAPMAEPCPECKVEGKIIKEILGAAPMVDPMRVGRVKMNSDFRDLMRGMDKFYSGRQSIKKLDKNYKGHSNMQVH